MRKRIKRDKKKILYNEHVINYWERWAFLSRSTGKFISQRIYLDRLEDEKENQKKGY